MLVTTDEAANILTNSADLPGQIIDLGEGATQYGHYYGKASNTSADHSSLGTPNSLTGFTSQVTNLDAGTKYYFKAYITDGQETVYGKEKTFTTLAASSPALTTTAITSITLTGAVSGGNITSDGGTPVTNRGVCWNSFTGPTTSNNKTVDGTGSGTYTSTLSGLTAGSTYFVRAYATNSAGTTYGNELAFTTTAASIPTVTTTAISGIAFSSALSGGNVSSDGGSPVLEKGVCWSTAAVPTISNTKTTNGPGTGSFASDISGLSPATKYYVRAYATNIVGTAYGSEVSFTTSNAPVQLPVLTTLSPGSVTSLSAASGGDISSDGGASITSRGVCWNTTGSPTTDGLKTTNGSGVGTFASSITGLTPNTKYYLRAYAINSTGTGYGNEYNFTTLSASSAVITTTAITSIAQTTASGGGNITSDGGAAITARGICWSLNQNPTLADANTVNDFGTGIFNSQLTSLSPGKTYYVRAYATNSTGTTYGSQVSFLTASDIPKVSTSAVGTVTATTADVGGEVLDNNGSTTTTRGVCYNLIGSPTIGDNIKSETGGIGTFTVSLTGLAPNTNYYLKAFATNGVGTAYGSQVQFTTPATIPSLTTAAVSLITTTTASSGGVISTDGGNTILNKGVCWSLSSGPVSGGTNQTNDGGGSSNYTSAITGLLPNTTYYLRAYATNGKGTAYGNELTFKTNTIASTVPGAPTGVSATPGNAQAIVTFTVPGTDGGSAITGYTVTSSPGGVTATGSASPVTVTGLTNGTSYTFTVTATNAIGTSIASSASNSVTPSTSLTVPGVPTGVTATAGNAQATVTFTAPVSNGGSAITGYTVTSSPGGITATGSVSPVILTGLTNGTSYTFTVTATNINGPGPASTASNSVIPSTIPGAPNMGTATAGDAMASVTFTPPVSDGGSAITVFIVTSNPGGHQGTGVVSPVNVTGLTNGTSYTFTITATNINGTGAVSTTSNSIIPSTIPGAPTIGTATAGNAQATVTFTAPVNNGGSSITGYTVTSSPGGITASGTISPIIVTGLTNGTAYTFTVIAKNVNGSGAASSASNSVTPVTVPSVSTTAASAITSNSAISGGSVNSNGGSTVTVSGICWSISPSPVATGSHSTDGTVSGSFTSAITGLNYNTTYYVRAYATNSVGTAYGNEVQFKTLCIIPTVTTSAATNIGTTTATLNGTINANNLSTIPLFKYGTSTSYGSTINSTPYSVDGTTSIPVSVDIINLTPGTLYHFVVLAGSCGTDIYGSDLTFTTLLPAPTITNFPDIIKNFGDPSFTLTPPTSNSSGAFSYVSSNASVATISGSTVTITGLGNTTITATQAATSSYASGTVSAAMIVNVTKPSLSTNAITAITSTSAVSGGNITSNGGATVTASGVCWSTTAAPIATGNHTADGTASGTYASSIAGLTLGQTYYVRAYATNSEGIGYGNEISFTTALAVGESYQGGIIAYVLQSGDPGYVAGQFKGLIVAPSDQSTIAEWGCYGISITGADGIALGTGNQNTTDIVAGCTTAGIAAKLCNDLVLGGYSDWYLPSKDELSKLYLNKAAIGGLADDWYFSSSEIDNNYVWYQYFSNGNQYFVNKSGSAYVRAIRAFPAAPVLPVVSTTAASAITSTTATTGGNVLGDGGADITARGVCWGIAPGLTVSGSHTTDAPGSGIFTSSLTGLSSNTKYYIRAYAINSVGTVYGSELFFTTSAGIPIVTSTAVSAIASTSVRSGGNVTSDGGSPILSQGVCWGTTADPTIAGSNTSDGSGLGIFTSNPTGLSSSTSYHLRAYATNSVGIAYGADILFSTTPLMTDGSGNSYNTIQIGTQLWMKENLKTTKYRDGTDIPNVTNDAAWASLLTGAYSEYGNNISNVAVYGRLYNYYATIDNKNLCPTGWHVPTDAEWTSLLTYLGGDGVAGGKLKEKGTLHWNPPNEAATDVSGFTGLPGGYRNNGGGYSGIRDLGQFWSSTPNSATNGLSYTLQFEYANVPRYAYMKVGGFSVRCMQGEGQVLPAVTTTAITAITSTTATSGGNVTSSGNSTVTARGVCWSTSTGPTITDTHTTDANGTGVFTSSISGLTLGQTYYVRAYATNSVGTAYGNELSFTAALAIGDAYQGGKVAYIFQPGDPGYIAGQTHGLIVALSDQGSAIVNWGCVGISLSGADGLTLGTGKQNTIDILAGCAEAGIAARLCMGVTINGYSDWYLPSKDELNKLFLNKSAIGVLNNVLYWSSTEYNNNNAWTQYFSNGSQSYEYKNEELIPRSCRAIRSF